jgi:hypothetical protein
MTTPKSNRTWHTILWLPALLLLLFAISPVKAANYSLEIIQPQPNLDTRNRFYKAYPGLEYNVRLAVIGGDYPYRYELVSGPSGMSIDGRGEITWPNPTEASSAYPVSVRVTDSAGTARSVDWTITVTTSGFLFVDAVKGTPASQGGTGTMSNPWKSLKDVYGGDTYNDKHSAHHSGAFVYWRGGTYLMDAYVEDCPSECRVPLINNYKPQVWLAYPGERPVFKMNTPSGGDAYITYYSGGDNAYLDGLEFDLTNNARGKGVVFGGGRNVTFRRNVSHGIRKGWNGGNNSLVFITNSGTRYSVQDNVGYNVNLGYWLLGYHASRVLVENNRLYNIGYEGDSHPIGPKQATQMWFIRGNHFHDNPRNSFNLLYGTSGGGVQSGDIEVSFNLVTRGGGKVRINSSYVSGGRPVHVFRNTFVGEVDVSKVTSSNGPFRFYNNVIVNETSHPDKIQRNSIEDPSRLIVSDNLVGSSSDNIVDDQGNLTSDYKSYLGTRGHQIGDQLSPPQQVRLVTR